MNKTQFVKRLYEEVPALLKGGVLSDDAAQKLKAHYGQVQTGSKMQVALAIFTVVGALCVGLGIILLFAYNWDQFSRLVKTGISMLPLVAAQIFSGLVVWKDKQSAGAREGAAIFNMLAVGASIALISQTYHMPNDFGSFMLTWMLLSLPLIYLLQSGLAALLFLIGITSWAVGEQITGGYSFWFWPLALLIAPYMKQYFVDQSASSRSIWLFWGMSICMTVALGVSLEKVIPGLWIVIYSAFFASLYLAGVLFSDEDTATWQRPMRTFGSLASIILSYILTFKFAWEHIGWEYYRTGARYHMLGQVSDYVLLIVFVTTAVIQLRQVLQSKKYFESTLGALPLLSMACFLLYSLNILPIIPSMFFNLYLFAFSLYCVFYGLQMRRLGIINGGMLILGVLIMTRFMDSSIGILGRAIVFIFLGVCFLTANSILSKKFEGGVQHV